MAVPPSLRYHRSPRTSFSDGPMSPAAFTSLAEPTAGVSLASALDPPASLTRSLRGEGSSRDPASALSPSSSLRSIVDLGLGTPPDPTRSQYRRERALSSASNTSSSGGRDISGTLLRTPLMALPSPGLDEPGPSTGWGTFSSVATTPPPPPPKPQGRKTLDFFATYTAPPASTSLPAPGNPPSSPVPPPPLRAPVSALTGAERIRSARTSLDREREDAATHERQTSATSIDSRGLSRSPDPVYRASARGPRPSFTSSPSSSRDPSPSPSFSHLISNVNLRMDNVPSRSRTDDFFSSWSSPGSSPTTSTFPSIGGPSGSSSPPRVVTVAATPTTDSPPQLPPSMARDPSLRTQIFHKPLPSAPTRGDLGDRTPHSLSDRELSRGLKDVGKLPSFVLDPRTLARPAEIPDPSSDPNRPRTRKQRQEEAARLKEEAQSEIRVGAVLIDPGTTKGKGRASNDDDDGPAEDGMDTTENGDGPSDSYEIVKVLGEGAFSRVVQGKQLGTGEVVAIKMIQTAAVDGNKRMKSSVGREMGVLKHIHHPSIVSLLSAFSTPHHTALVLECATGGELFDLLTSRHDAMDEPLARRIFGELCGVVGWMHKIGVVHRDVKLENILLTRRLFSALGLETDALPPPSEPLIKLTDFGLSRFIDFGSPLLSTRCGSEEYAAPELLLGRPYDGRKTDAWAVGVVGYALLVGHLPFAPDQGLGEDDTVGAPNCPPGSAKSRRGYLLKIAKADYRWPTSPPSATRIASPAGKEVVDALLKREPAKRIEWSSLWQMGWFEGSSGGKVVREGVRQLEGRARGRRPSEGSEAARMLAGEQEPPEDA